MELGCIKNGHVSVTKSADFVGMYIGQTSGKTRDVVERVLDGVLFVDEVYTLASYNSYGLEALSEIVTLMELYRNRIVFVFSGYSKEMNIFLEQNPAFSRRIAHVINFPDYSVVELIDILESMASQRGFNLLPESKENAKSYLINVKATQNPYFGNALEARILLEKMEAKCAERIFRENIELENRPNILPGDVPELMP